MVKCAGCQEPAHAVHKEDLLLPPSKQRRICKHRYDELAQYIDGQTDWLVIRRLTRLDGIDVS